MNDGDPERLFELTRFSLLATSLIATFLVAGAISALSMLLRMRSGGLIDEGQPIPASRLLDSMRSVLLALSVAYLALACAATALLVPGFQIMLDGQPGWLHVLSWFVFASLLLLGSMLSKALALSKPIGFARAVEPLVWVCHILLWPLTKLLERALARVAPSLWALELSPPLSGSEIRGALADDEAAALMDHDEVGWARSIFELGETEIREIMVPRIDMVGLEVDTPLPDAVKAAAAARYTRLPVWEGSQDKILGILHAKDLLVAAASGNGGTVRSLLRKVHFLPESKKIDEALSEFREGRIHLAVVVDEYGGTAGIVTLEDILEEIVGEIRDEFDQEGELVRLVDSHRAVIDPRIDLDDLNAMLGLELPTDEVDTLGGLLYQLCGRVPERGDDVEHEGLRFTVDRVERQRIRQVTLTANETLRTPSANGDAARE